MEEKLCWPVQSSHGVQSPCYSVSNVKLFSGSLGWLVCKNTHTTHTHVITAAAENSNRFTFIPPQYKNMAMSSNQWLMQTLYVSEMWPISGKHNKCNYVTTNNKNIVGIIFLKYWKRWDLFQHYKPVPTLFAVGSMALFREVLTMDCTFIQTCHPSMYLLLVTNLTVTRNCKCYELDIQYNVN